MFCLCRSSAFCHNSFISLFDFHLAVLTARQQISVSRIIDLQLGKHLAYDYFNVLIVDIYTLLLVYTLYFLQQVLIYAFYTVESQDILRIKRSSRDVVASQDVVPFRYTDPCSVRNFVNTFLFASYLDLSFIIHCRLNGNHCSIRFTDHRKTLRLSGFKQFLDSWQTVGDIGSGHTTGMECSHSQLSTRLTDGLRCSDTNSFSNVNAFARSQVAPVTLCTNAGFTMTCHYRTDRYRLNACFLDAACHIFGDLAVLLYQDLSSLRICNISQRCSAHDTVF